MIRACGRRGLRAALLVCTALSVSPASAQSLLVVQSDKGAEIGRLALNEGDAVCLSWAHSVTGGAVADCFENRAGALWLARSYLHDFAAGLGEVPGRGRLLPAQGGGYWIVDIDEPIPDNALRLRVGSPSVGHVLWNAAHRLDLSAKAAGARVTLRLVPQDP